MADGKADPRLTPGVPAAVAWLIGRENENETSVLQRAYMKGLLRKGRGGDSWKCDGSLLTRLVGHRVRSGKLPMHGGILIGIGEMIARSHSDKDEIESLLGRLCRRTYPEATRQRVFQQALDVVRPKKSIPQSSSSIVCDAGEFSIMDWKQMAIANQCMQHPERPDLTLGYGLRFIVRVLLHHEPDRLQWLAVEADKRGLLSPIVAAVAEACNWDEKAAKQAIKSGVPFFVGFGVAQLRQGCEDGNGLQASAVDAILIDRKMALEGRKFVSAFMLKEAVHTWHRQKDRPFENRRTRLILAISPHQAIGGESNATHQIERLEDEAPELERRRSAVMLALDDALQTAAQQDINPEQLWSVFEPSLVDNPEIRHRFAMAHMDGDLRRAALEKALATFDKLVGVRRLKTICAENFDSFRAGREFAFWAASSQVELSKINGSDMGHDAARRIGKIEPVLRNFLLQPFAATRFHERFQNNIGRWSVMLQFAFLVALSDRKEPLVRLRNEALKSASAFLPRAERCTSDPQWGEAVACLVADAVSTMQKTDFQNWINDERQPPLLRAKLIWACPAILSNDLNLATSLISKIAARKTTRTIAGRNASCLLDILDRAAVAMKHENRSDLYVHLAIPYAAAIAQDDAPLAKSISMEVFIAALNGDLVARSELMENPIWGNSRLSVSF